MEAMKPMKGGEPPCQVGLELLQQSDRVNDIVQHYLSTEALSALSEAPGNPFTLALGKQGHHHPGLMVRSS